MESPTIMEQELSIKRAIWNPPFRGLLMGGSQVGKTEYFICKQSFKQLKVWLIYTIVYF